MTEALRVILVGSESSGKTTLALSLLEHYRCLGGAFADTVWVREFGRDYTEWLISQQGLRESQPDAEVRSAEWNADDFATIAIEQQKLEDEAAASGAPLILCDTDALATWLWERRYLGAGSFASRIAVPELPERALYLLSDIAGVPFEQDGIRDGEHLRVDMQRWFVEELEARGERWALVSGDREERLAASVAQIDAVLTEAGLL